MTSLSAGAHLNPCPGIRPFPCPSFPAPTWLRLPTTQSPYLLPQRLAVRDECRHLPAIAAAAFGHGVLAAWATRARAPGMIGEHGELPLSPEGVRSAGRPRRECAELARARWRRWRRRQRRRWRPRCPAPRPPLTPPPRHRRRRQQSLVPQVQPQPPEARAGWTDAWVPLLPRLRL